MKLCKISNERKRMAVFFFVFLILYTVSFAVLEQRVVPMNMMMCELDALIPFSEFFVIPYFFWFLYLVLTVGYFLLFCSDDSEVKSLLKSFPSHRRLSQNGSAIPHTPTLTVCRHWQKRLV